MCIIIYYIHEPRWWRWRIRHDADGIRNYCCWNIVAGRRRLLSEYITGACARADHHGVAAIAGYILGGGGGFSVWITRRAIYVCVCVRGCVCTGYIDFLLFKDEGRAALAMKKKGKKVAADPLKMHLFWPSVPVFFSLCELFFFSAVVLLLLLLLLFRNDTLSLIHVRKFVRERGCFIYAGPRRRDARRGKTVYDVGGYRAHDVCVLPVSDVFCIDRT